MRAYCGVAIIAFSLVGCGNATCKDKTLFVTFSLAGLSGADGVDVSVAVAGGVSKVSHVALPSTVTKPSIEIDFPNGYPSGQSVTVEVDVKAAAVLVGSGSATVTLTGSCATASVALTPAAVANKHQGDACGPDDVCDTGHCVDGYCCDAPCTGQCQACDVPNAIGACTTVSDGAPHGTRPACNGTGTCGGTCDGASAMACTYAAKSVICGAACDGHCDAMGGCTSVAGGSCPNGFACGSSGCDTSCSSDNDCQPNFHCMAPNCVRIPESDCLDGKDNNGDGLADCQDPTCTTQVACVPAAPVGDELGILTSAACPSAFSTVEAEHQNLTAPQCATTGCGCTPIVRCQVSASYSTATDCSNPIAITQTIDQPMTGTSANPPCQVLGGVAAQSLKYVGITYVSTACNATGSTTPPPTSWGTSTNFCATQKTSMTCDANQVCVAKPPASQTMCVRLPQPGAACPAGYAGQSATWYSQVDDTRACACGCNVTQAGTCTSSPGPIYGTHTANSCPTAASDPGCGFGLFGGPGTCSTTGSGSCTLSSPVGALELYSVGVGNAQCGSVVATTGSATAAGGSTICCQ